MPTRKQHARLPNVRIEIGQDEGEGTTSQIHDADTAVVYVHHAERAPVTTRSRWQQRTDSAGQPYETRYLSMMDKFGRELRIVEFRPAR